MRLANVWSLSQSSSLMPGRGVDSGVFQISRRTMAVIELRSAARLGMINSGCKKSSRQPVKIHPVNLSCPSMSAFSKADVQRLEAQTKLEFLLRDVELSHVPRVTLHIIRTHLL